MYPKFAVSINMKISAGDLLTAEVSSRGTTFKLRMTDATTGQSFKTKQTSTSATRSSAEWVVEASWGGQYFLPLTNFATVQFSGSYTTGSGHTGSISDAAWSNDEITMASSAAVTKAVPSALSPDGTAFSVTWIHT
jgi:Peptidase A4 family